MFFKKQQIFVKYLLLKNISTDVFIKNMKKNEVCIFWGAFWKIIFSLYECLLKKYLIDF